MKITAPNMHTALKYVVTVLFLSVARQSLFTHFRPTRRSEMTNRLARLFPQVPVDGREVHVCAMLY